MAWQSNPISPGPCPDQWYKFHNKGFILICWIFWFVRVPIRERFHSIKHILQWYTFKILQSNFITPQKWSMLCELWSNTYFVFKKKKRYLNLTQQQKSCRQKKVICKTLHCCKMIIKNVKKNWNITARNLLQ